MQINLFLLSFKNYDLSTFLAFSENILKISIKKLVQTGKLTYTIAVVNYFTLKHELYPPHGGPDGGASSGDVLEKDLNLSVSLKLRDIVNANGNSAVMTRETDDVEMSQNGKYSKKTDLQHRMDVLNSSQGDIFISIHMNKFSDSKYSGAQVFSSDNGDESKQLGEIIQSSLKNNLDNSNTRAAKGNERNVYILKNAKVPAVLVECGFLSNPDELKLLTEEEYQKKLSEAIYKGIEEYISKSR